MTNKRTQVLVNFLTTFGLIYTCSGGAQVIGSIYFIFILPTFETWSNIWTGLWGVVCGVTTLLLSCFGGGLTSGRAQAILLMSISVGCCNAINMLVMEIGEWRIFDGGDGHGHGHGHRHHQHHSHDHHYPSTTEDLGPITSSFSTYATAGAGVTIPASGGGGHFATQHFGAGYLVNDSFVFVNGTPSYAALREPTQNFRKDTMTHHAMEPDPFTAEVIQSLLSYAYLTTTISTAAALVSSFIASQYILCFMYRNEKNKQAGHPDAFRPTSRNPEDEPPGLSSPWLQRHSSSSYHQQYAMWMDKLYVEQHRERFADFLSSRNRQNCDRSTLPYYDAACGPHRGRTRPDDGDTGGDGGGRRLSRISVISASNEQHRSYPSASMGAVMDDDGGLRYGGPRRTSYAQRNYHSRLSRSNSFSSTSTLASHYSSIRSLEHPGASLGAKSKQQVAVEAGKSKLDKTSSSTSKTKQEQQQNHLGIGVELGATDDPDYARLKKLHDAYYGTKLTQGLPGVPGLGPSLASTRSSSSDSSSLHSSPSGYLHQAINTLYAGSSRSSNQHQLLQDPLHCHGTQHSLQSNNKKLATRTTSSAGQSSKSNSSSKRRFRHHATPEPIPLDVSQDRLLLVPAEQLQPSSTSAESSSSANSSVSGTYSQQQLASASSSSGNKKRPFARKTFSCPRDLGVPDGSQPACMPPNCGSSGRKISSDSSSSSIHGSGANNRRTSSAVLRRQSTQETSFSVDSRSMHGADVAVIMGDSDDEVIYEAIREVEI